jgi:cytochrome c553
LLGGGSRWRGAVLFFVVAIAMPAAWAQTKAPAAAQMCSTCHGANGISSAPDAPNLAGQPAIYLSAQLQAYRSGKRSHEVMNVIAKPLSDADIDTLASWYASFKIEAKLP